jgi:fluoroquinolone resistance protein
VSFGEQREHFDEAFSDIDCRSESIEGAEFNGCTFEKCQFSEAVLKRSRFVDCRFSGCDLSLIDVTDAAFGGVRLEECKALGVNWSFAANLPTEPLGLDFDGCVLNFSSFMGLDFGGRSITNCTVHDAVFSRTMLSGADCSGTDFAGSSFKHCDMSGADFRGAKNYIIDIETNRLAKAKFSLPEAISLLASLGIDLS